MKIPEQVFAAGLPFFIYSENEIQDSARTVRDLWKNWSLPGFEIFFSIKVNPNPHLLKILSRHVDGFDVSSLAEARLARQVSSKAALTWSGPAKTDRAYDEAAAMGIRCFHLDSVDDWLQFEKRKKQMPSTTRYSVRLSSNEIHSQKLGFSQAELKKLQSLSSQPALAVHSYLGREVFSAAAMDLFFQRLELAIQNGQIKAKPEIFLGAGIPAARLVQKHLTELQPVTPPTQILHLESGRGLIQSAGWYGTRILSFKKTSPSKSAIIDGGLQHMAAHFQSPRYKAEGVEIKFFRQGQELTDRSDLVSVLGSLSLWHDTMIENISAPAGLQRGDWIVASQMGAYGFAAASNQFLGPSRLQEWLVQGDQSLKEISANQLTAYQEASK